MVGFSPIASVISKVFNCSIVLVEMQTLLFLAAFIPANFTAIYLLPRKGLRWTLIAGGGLLMGGAWLRILVNITGKFEMACIGSVFAAFGQTFFYNCTSKLASEWFGDGERTIATTLGSIAIPIGSITGFIMPTIMIGEADLEDEEKGKGKIGLYIWIQCIIVTIAVINLIYQASDKPPTPPSLSASQPQPQFFDFKSDYRSLISNKSYLMLALSFGTVYANSGALAAIISAMTRPYGYKIRDNAIFGSAFILCGILGAILGGLLTDKYRKFKLTLQLLSGMTSLLTFLTLFSLPTASVPLLALNLGLVGLFSIPMNPLSFAFAVELTYPIPEAMSNGMMLLPSKIYGAVLGLVTAELCEVNPKWAIGAFWVNTVVSAGASWFIREELRRLNQ
ncbi:hypothetical protein FGO68_gene3853 [Halteria grandinella]|uniref:Major facilitator superfamily (MFS) profile domain-containing protein n=1 Tax=Halteria grandinella TaxID=5974 RepID=A0A8J8NQN4_HALGN|nr:hypothetical protein FGO68_gene3853 [Halteria grandinella]